MKVKIILNETYVAFQEKCFKERIGSFVNVYYVDGRMKYHTNLFDIQKALSDNKFVLFHEEDADNPILYNTDIIRKIEIL